MADKVNPSVALDERRFRVPQVAEKLGVAQKTVWSWVGSRRIAVQRMGRTVTIPESSIREFLESGFTPAKD